MKNHLSIKTSLRLLTLLGLLGLLGSTQLHAEEAKPKSEVGRREENQQDRIAQGVESGQLSPAETAKLEKREAELREQIKNDRGANGGKLTPEERKKVNHELNHISKRIHHAKHNDKQVPPAK